MGTGGASPVQSTSASRDGMSAPARLAYVNAARQRAAGRSPRLWAAVTVAVSASDERDGGQDREEREDCSEPRPARARRARRGVVAPPLEGRPLDAASSNGEKVGLGRSTRVVARLGVRLPGVIICARAAGLTPVQRRSPARLTLRIRRGRRSAGGLARAGQACGTSRATSHEPHIPLRSRLRVPGASRGRLAHLS